MSVKIDKHDGILYIQDSDLRCLWRWKWTSQRRFRWIFQFYHFMIFFWQKSLVVIIFIWFFSQNKANLRRAWAMKFLHKRCVFWLKTIGKQLKNWFLFLEYDCYDLRSLYAKKHRCMLVIFKLNTKTPIKNLMFLVNIMRQI